MKLNQTIFRWLLSAHVKNKLSILIYHRVRENVDALTPYDLGVNAFERQMKLISRYFDVVTVSEGIRKIRENDISRPTVAITFDDGYVEQYDIALPILNKYGLKASFYVTTGYFDGGMMWNDYVVESFRNIDSGNKNSIDLTEIGFGCHSVSSITEKRLTLNKLLIFLKRMHPSKRDEAVDIITSIMGGRSEANLMLSQQQIRNMANAGMEIGCHTKMHPILTSLSDNEVIDEIAGSKAILEEILEKPVHYFAYPNGKPYEDYMPEHIEIVKDLGFYGALSTAKGVATGESDFFQLPRFTPWDDGQFKFMLRLIGNYSETEPLIV